jgi:hypothetical protein
VPHSTDVEARVWRAGRSSRERLCVVVRRVVSTVLNSPFSQRIGRTSLESRSRPAAAADGEGAREEARRPFDDGEMKALARRRRAARREAARPHGRRDDHRERHEVECVERARAAALCPAGAVPQDAAPRRAHASPNSPSTTWGDWSEKLRTLTLRAETTKSKKSRRIPLLASVEQDLRALREIHREGYGRAPKPHEPIFVTPTGQPLVGAYANAKRFFGDAMERAGLKPVDQRRGRLCMHGLRHTFASRLARANAGLTQAQMLHSTPGAL